MARFTKKKKIVVITAAMVLTGGAAFAYWTTGGSGTGSGATGTSANIVANQTSTVTAMGPGVAAQGISGDFTNLTAGPAYVTTVTVSIASVVKDPGAVAGTCDATDYLLSNNVVTVGTDVPVGTNVSTWGASDTPLLSFVNKATNQDQCKLATVNLAFAIA